MVYRKLDFRSFADVTAELNRLLAYGYTKHGNWTLGQTCAHLAIFIEGSLEGFKGPRVPWYTRMLAPLFVRWTLKHRRMPAWASTPKECEPPPAVDDQKDVRRLKALLQRFERHAGPLHPSPFGGNASREVWTEMHLIHCAQHLGFLQPR
jgi:hypothetical protein